MQPEISISIVSHGQFELVDSLLADLRKVNHPNVEVILTLNIPEPADAEFKDWPFPVYLRRNQTPRGFGANHNAALLSASANWLCVLNPDLRIPKNPFPALVETMADSTVGVCAPLVLSPSGEVESSARAFPTPGGIWRKALLGAGAERGNDENARPDWLAGMFLFFRRDAFVAVGGFDERYFLYYEDVDICARLRLAGYRAGLCKQSNVVHAARRTSHRSFRYAAIHLRSMARWFLSDVRAEIS